MSEGAFFQDLAMLMAIAGVVAIVFSRLGWPKVIGYILAGILMGEHTWGGALLADPLSTQTIGQLGVVFLMFGMGLSFSPREMKKIRTVALPVALFDAAVMIVLGYTVGRRLFGWSAVQSVFLGVAICDSATTLLAKVIDEMGWSDRPFAKYVLGTSVCEDIICVGAIAVATGFASGGAMSLKSFLGALGGLGVFFLTVLVFGFILVPRLLKSVSRRRDDEALVLAILGCCFFISYFAYRFDYSLALGAFLVGVIGGSSDVRDRLFRLLDPLKSMFSAVFFVSIGLLVDPSALWHCLPQILLVSAVIVCGKFFNVTLASLVAGVDVKTAVQNGLGLAQIGEFAFMVAILYAGIVGDASSPMFPIAIGASLLTTLVNPWMIRLSDVAGGALERIVPERMRARFDAYRVWIDKIRTSDDSPAVASLRGAAIRLGVYAVLMMSVFVSLSMLHAFDFTRFSRFFERHDTLILFFCANIFALLLLPLIVRSSRALGDAVVVLLLGSGEHRRGPLGQIVRLIVLIGIIALFFVEWVMLVLAFAPADGLSLGVSFAVLVIVGVFGWRFFVKAGRQATTRFNEALTAEERREVLARTMTIQVPVATIHRFVIKADSPAIGGTVVSLNIRARTGVSVVAAIRDGETFHNIGPGWTFKAGDTLVVLGEPDGLTAIKQLLGVGE